MPTSTFSNGDKKLATNVGSFLFNGLWMPTSLLMSQRSTSQSVTYVFLRSCFLSSTPHHPHPPPSPPPHPIPPPLSSRLLASCMSWCAGG
ncbi:hypothetical protein S7711_10599 [Stachybotrys chartarum IBT 7711]|uniref:Uncharacterized protein n=1 Tax=Stachybotrys chartarum (strain CBS 109288 / IBT 7711) TaxID=1280523 RepID=A0A084AYW4_STACB|nr:hypothetical protein S7711_10599 [Stachybotrys chartarum IBT 7711]